MYLPRIFDGAAHRDLTLALMRTHPLATVVAHTGGAPEIAHVPVIVAHEEPLRLSGHVARANPFARHVEASGAVTAVFHGPEAYVSAAWYTEPAEQVPTWNYAVIHAKGRLEVLDDEALYLQLDALARTFEGEGGWSTSLPAPDFHAELRRGIVGFVLHVDELDVKLKMSQNRSPGDRERVREALAQSVSPRDLEVAALMRRLA